MKYNNYILLGIAFTALPVSIQAQTQPKDTTVNRTVIVEQQYNPDIMDAAKVNVLPKVEEPSVSKKEVEYATFTTPATSIPAGTIGAYTGKEIQPGFIPGYVRLGYGNYGNLDVLANYLFRLSDRDKLNVNFKMDGMDGTLDMPFGDTRKWNAFYYRTRANVDYVHQFAKLDLNVAGNFGLSNFNYEPYGFKKQKFTSGDVHFGVKSTDETLPLQYRAETNLMLYGLAMRDLKSIYVDMNRIDEFAALASAMPGNIRFDASEQDSLTYMAAEKIYIRGRVEQAKESFGKYLQTFPDGAFGLNAHYYLCLIGKEQKNYDMILEHSGKLLEYPDNPFSEEALIMRAEVQFNKVQFADALASYKMLKEKATTAERRLLAETGMLRAAYLLKDDTETIHAATALLSEAKLSPELKNEALYYRAKAYLNQKADKAAMGDLKELAKDTRNLYGAEAKFLVAQELYNSQNYAAAEKELLNFIDQSTPHAYWLARGFILLSDVYVAMDKKLDARQYLLSLQQNYHADDDIESMIESRLNNLNK